MSDEKPFSDCFYPKSLLALIKAEERISELEASSASHTENIDGVRRHTTELEKWRTEQTLKFADYQLIYKMVHLHEVYIAELKERLDKKDKYYNIEYNLAMENDFKWKVGIIDRIINSEGVLRELIKFVQIKQMGCVSVELIKLLEKLGGV